MAIVWPTTLPEFVLSDGYSEEAPKTSIATKMDYGPKKRRRRSTAAERPFKLRIALTADQVEILDDFFVNDLAGGALLFDWVHPRTGAAVEFGFTDCKPPKYSNPGGGEKWYADIEIEVMP